MAKKSMINREKKRQKLVAKYAAKRAALKKILRDPEASDEEIWDAQTRLQKQPRDASPSRQRRRCSLTGRPNGVYRRFEGIEPKSPWSSRPSHAAPCSTP